MDRGTSRRRRRRLDRRLRDRLLRRRQHYRDQLEQRPNRGPDSLDMCRRGVRGRHPRRLRFSAIGFGGQTLHDCATIVAGSPVNFLSEANGSGFAAGIGGLFHTSDHSTNGGPLGALVYYEVQAGDISGGNVTLRMYYSNSTNGTLNAGISFQVVNYGQTSSVSPSPTGLAHGETVVAADVAANSATWATMTGYEVTIAAAAGDLVDLFMTTYPNAFSGSAQLVMDIGTVVSAAVVNRISGGTGNSDLGCVESLQIQGSGQALYGGHVTRRYVVQAGDVSGGQVTFRGLYRNPAGSCTLSASATIRSIIQATNLGPAA